MGTVGSTEESQPTTRQPPQVGSDGNGNDGQSEDDGPAWEWPPWSLSRRPPLIEVLVCDETTGQRQWLPAVPLERVCDTRGRDKYLCARYQWGSESCVQYFGPDHVRKRGGDGAVVSGSRGGVGAGASATTDASTSTCAICMDAPSDAVLVPCLHGGICMACAEQLLVREYAGAARCPQCRTPMEWVIPAARPEPQGPRPPEAYSWEWPPWCVKEQGLEPPMVEVFVTDESARFGRWVRATAIGKVVHGNDKYLTGEYRWDGAVFQEDFGPHRVRQCGMLDTVAQQLLRNARTGSMRSLRTLVDEQREMEKAMSLSQRGKQRGCAMGWDDDDAAIYSCW